VVVSTVSPEGRPAARAVVLEGYDEAGFLFWSSSESPKGRELAANPAVALVFLWPTRQVRVEGVVESLSEQENDEHWAACQGKRQLVAFRQSDPIGSRTDLYRLVEDVPENPPRPAFWVGYRVQPALIEFWERDPEYVHDRIRFTRQDGSWTATRLQP
jgi:pyridoxamine 5'-phosphate oxidase